MRRCRCCYPYNVLALFLFSTLCVCIVCMCAHTPTRIQGVILSKLQVAVSCDSRGSSSLIGTLVRLSKRDYSTQKVVHTACICVYKRSPGNCVCMIARLTITAALRLTASAQGLSRHLARMPSAFVCNFPLHCEAAAWVAAGIPVPYVCVCVSV